MLSFEEIISQEKTIKYLRKAVREDKVSHAYIINGDKGLGKKTLANAFSLELFCTADKGRPCLSCHACKQTLAGTNPDIIYVKHEKPGIISVSEIRKQLVETALIKPYSGRYKLYIVDEAHKLNTEAQNAVLKTIEEPPPYVIICLLTNNSDIFLDTVKSRCVKLNMNHIKERRIEEYLKNSLGAGEEEAKRIASYSRGNLGAAIDMYRDEEKKRIYKENCEILKNIKWTDMAGVIEYARLLNKRDTDLREFVDFCRSWYRDVLLIKDKNEYSESEKEKRLIFKSEYKSLLTVAKAYSFTGLNKILEALDETTDRLSSNVSTDLSISVLLEELRDA